MKKARFITPILTVSSVGLVTAPIVTSCSKNITIEDVKFNQEYSYVEVNTSKDFSQKITITPAEASKDGLTWSITKSSENNDSVAIVDANTGILTGLNTGYVQLTCTSKADPTKTTSEWVVVGNFVPLKDFNLAFDEKIVFINETAKIFRTYSPENATTALYEDVLWESDNDEVATVDEDGNVKGIAPGVATITATPRDYDIYTKEYKPIESLKKTCKITIDYAPVEYVSVSSKEMWVEAGQQFVVKPTVYPATAKQGWTYKIVGEESVTDKITYDTETNTISVAEDCPTGWGGIVFIAEDDTTKSAYCSINIQEKVIQVESIAFADKTKTITVEDTWTPTITVLPDEATHKDYYFEFKDTSIADVDPSEPTKIIGKKEGTTTITVYSQNHKHSDTCELTVEKKTVHVESVSLPTEANCGIDKTITLNPTILPVDATDKTVTWSSSKPEIATIDENGTITGLKEGTTVITVTTNDGAHTATCTLKVAPEWKPIESISLLFDTYSLNIGETFEQGASIYPSDATYKHITWHTDDESIVSIQQTGPTQAEITGRAKGIAKVYATALDGSFVSSSFCYVTVTPVYDPITKFELSTTSLKLVTGDKKRLALPTIEPETACKDVTWSSSSPTTVSVDKDGNLSAIKAGQATITCTSLGVDSEGKHPTSSCTVDVFNEIIHVQSVKIDSPFNIYMEHGTTLPLPNVIITPSDATIKDIVWKTERDHSYGPLIKIDPVAKTMSVDLDYSILGFAPNKLTAISADNPSATNYVYVCIIIPSAKSIEIKSCPKTMNVNEIGYIQAEVQPFNARRNLSFKSLTPEVLTVDQTGKILASNPGEGRIEITSEDQKVKTVCTIQVFGYKSFSTDSWENVCKYANEGVDSLRSHYSLEFEQNQEFPNSLIGYTRTVFCNGIAHMVRVVDMNHDNLQDKKGAKAALTFELADVLSDTNGNPTTQYWGMGDRGDDCSDYHRSNLRNFLCGPCLTNFKEQNPDLGNNLKLVRKEYYYMNTNWPIPWWKKQARGTYLFPLSAKEMNVGSGKTEGYTYAWYNVKRNKEDRIHRDLNGNPQDFWLISANTGHIDDYWQAFLIEKSGNRGKCKGGCHLGVVFGFCI